MKSAPVCLFTLVCVSALSLGGCSDLSPAETSGPFRGANANLAAADINRGATYGGGGAFTTGSTDAAVSRAIIHVIAKHQASVRQRQIAIQRAKAAYSHLQARRPKVTTSNGPARKHERPAALPRYIAVDTVKDEHTAAGAQKAVMIWDTQSQEIVGNNVYDISNPPPAGTTSRFETYSAEYVGAGL